MHYAQVKFTCVLNRRLFSFASHPTTCRHIQSLLLLKKLFTSLHFTLANKLSDHFNANNDMREVSTNFL